MNVREAGFIEGYAAALQGVLKHLTGDDWCGKSYDPMTVDLRLGVLHSYAFDMKDGGRHHPIGDYADFIEICQTLLDEVLPELKAAA